jgi:hypothetical protein
MIRSQWMIRSLVRVRVIVAVFPYNLCSLYNLSFSTVCDPP